MSKKKKRKASSSPSKKAESPFFRPFSNLSVSGQQPSPAPAGPTRSKPTQPSSEPDDSVTFERFMSGVEPLEKSQARRVSRTQADVDSTLSSRVQRIAHEQKMADEQALNKLHALVEEGSRFEVFDDGRQVEGRRRGVDGGLVRRMRNGELTPDATLDLLGLGLEQAKAAVQTFIRERRTKGDRVVVIRFRRGMGASSVLRGELVAWLSEGKTAFHIAAFLTSPPEFGGEDCLSVLIAQPAERYRGMK